MPWLMLIYPALVFILIMNLFFNFKHVRLVTQVGTIIDILLSIEYFLPGIGFGNNFFTRINSSLPLGNHGLWLVSTVTALIAGLIFVKSSKSKKM